MEEVVVNEKEKRFFNYWEQRFNTILNEKTSWTRLFLTVNKSSFPESVNIDSFCNKFIHDFNLNLSYKYNESDNEFDLTITR